jgi:hypothetical protein
MNGMNDEQDDDFDDEVSVEEWADAARAVEAFRRWTDAAEREGDPRAAAAHLAYGNPAKWGPPPKGVMLDDLARWMNAAPDDVCRWLKISPTRLWPPRRPAHDA